MAVRPLPLVTAVALTAVLLAGCTDPEGEARAPRIVADTGGQDTTQFQLQPTLWEVSGKGVRELDLNCNTVCEVLSLLGMGDPNEETDYTFELEGLPQLKDDMGYQVLVTDGEITRQTPLFRPNEQGQADEDLEMDDAQFGPFSVTLFVSFTNNEDRSAVVATANFTQDAEEAVFTEATPGEGLFGDGRVDSTADPQERSINITLVGVWPEAQFRFEAWLEGRQPQSLGLFEPTPTGEAMRVAARVPTAALSNFAVKVTLEPESAEPGTSSQAVVLESLFVGG